jgi:nicotinate phosphoribosyltransferase
MDHFAVQAAERPGVPPADTERQLFAAFADIFPEQSILLVDTYDTWRGIAAAIAATGGKLTGVRLDSAVTPDAVRRARTLLDAAGARTAKILVSDGLDEWRVRELVAAGADGVGVGENITCSPDAPVGIGAVAKLVENGYGKLTMKWSLGTGKSTLPGKLQAYRFADRDVIALADEPPPKGGRALLEPIWEGRAPVRALPSVAESRAAVGPQIAALPGHLRDLGTDHNLPWQLQVSEGLADLVRRCVKEAIG